MSYGNTITALPVLDLATRFADGRLSTEKLIQADDEELANMLIEVRGIGRVGSFWLTSFQLILIRFGTVDW
jgi:hypothetical protein